MGQSSSQRGSIAIYLALALVIFGLLMLAGVARFSSSVRGVVSPNCATSARYMAESGMRYAVARLRACANKTALDAAVNDMNAHGLYVMNEKKGLGFTLTISYNSGYIATVVSKGSGCSIIAPVTYTVSNNNVNLPTVAINELSITFDADLNDFTIAAKGTSGAISKDTSDKSISLGNNVSGMSSGVWYTGTNALCDGGACYIGNGVCATYTLRFNPFSTTQGDGLAWVIMNADNNSDDSFGGGGEYIGYAGVSESGTTINAPKLVMEYDITPNWKNCGKVCYATDQVSCDDSSSDNEANDHVAFMFWGSQSCSCGATLDDHIHGAGSGTAEEPYNSYDFDGDRDGADGYYMSPSATSIGRTSGVWLRANNAYKTYYVRYELDRATTPNAQGNYVYTQRAWLSTSALPACSHAMTTVPTVERSVALTPAMHSKLARSYFGWTVGSGTYSEIAKLSDFALNFKAKPTWTDPTPPSDYVAAFPMNEGAGFTTYDIGANGFTGALNGAVMWTPDVRAVTGTSLFFTNAGTPGYVSVPDASALRLTSAGTIACWAYLHSTPSGTTTEPLVYKSGAYELALASSYNWRTRTTTTYLELIAGGRTVTASVSLGASAWHHLAATWSNKGVTLYVDGSAVSTSHSSVSASSSSSPLYIGGDGSRSFDGRLDDLYLYDRALSDSEIAQLVSGTHY